MIILVPTLRVGMPAHMIRDVTLERRTLRSHAERGNEKCRMTEPSAFDGRDLGAFEAYARHQPLLAEDKRVGIILHRRAR